ncbi:MAG: hypothetical protein D6824_05370 [Planctomycetota bacterium]|nr:MAG: hypothetical protein D6824_05370 [Planctomycetota bacterium]
MTAVPDAASAEAQGSAATPDAAALSRTRTTLSRRWLLKLGVFAVGLAALGVWALYDGLVAFPARGREAAAFAELQYLQAVRDAGAISQASVDDPKRALAELRTRRSALLQQLQEAQGASRTAAAARTAMELKRLDWLEALSRVGWLEPARTRFDDPLQRLSELEQQWRNKPAPKRLSAYDIPLQWAIVAGCALALAWIAFLLLRARAKTYRFDAERLALTLPDGRTVAPEDVEEFDKRKWHKFFVTLRLRDGVAVELDLLRYEPLEAWVLAMEQAANAAEQEQLAASSAP